MITAIRDDGESAESYEFDAFELAKRSLAHGGPPRRSLRARRGQGPFRALRRDRSAVLVAVNDHARGGEAAAWTVADELRAVRGARLMRVEVTAAGQSTPSSACTDRANAAHKYGGRCMTPSGYRYSRRAFLNLPGESAGAYILACVREGGWRPEVRISDCDRIVRLEFEQTSPRSRRNALRKADLLIDTLTEFRAALVESEAARRRRR